VDHSFHGHLSDLTASSHEAAALRARGVTVAYGGRAALSRVSLELAAGEMTALLGPNGSGKTSLFRVLATQTEPAEGSVEIEGIDPKREPGAARRRLGVVFQSPALDPRLTAREILRHQGRLYGLSGSALKAAVEEALGRANLRDRGSDRVDTFSGGMKRRLDLVRGLLHRPSVLLLDEPTASLDPSARADFWSLVNERRRDGLAGVFFTTHDLEEAERADRVGILCEGKLVAEGRPEELKSGIRGDVVTIEAPSPEVVAAEVSSRFAVPASVVGGAVRVEHERGAEFLVRLAEAFPGRLRSLRVARPTLGDVYTHATGRRFAEEEE
jgi:ABC-2 type transport system ATP-binding protein